MGIVWWVDKASDCGSTLKYEYNRVFAGRNWNNGETVGANTVLTLSFTDTEIHQ